LWGELFDFLYAARIKRNGEHIQRRTINAVNISFTFDDLPRQGKICVKGDYWDTSFCSFYVIKEVWVRHGLTAGETKSGERIEERMRKHFLESLATYRELLGNLFIQIVDKAEFTVKVADFINLHNERYWLEEAMTGKFEGSGPLYFVDAIKKGVVRECPQIWKLEFTKYLSKKKPSDGVRTLLRFHRVHISGC
jgi:hypothetical protein